MQNVNTKSGLGGRGRTGLILVEVEYGGAERTADVSLRLVRLVQEPNLERDESVGTEVDPVDLLVRGPVPDVQVLTVFTCSAFRIMYYLSLSHRKLLYSCRNTQSRSVHKL